MEERRVYDYGSESSMSVWDWLLTLILASIPVVGFILLIMWSFSGSESRSKSNWAKATLIIQFAGVILMVLFWTSMAASLAASGIFNNF